MSKAFKMVLMICAIVLVLALSGSMIYYFAFAKPANERAELDWEKEKLKSEDTKERQEKQEEEQKEQIELLKELTRENQLNDCLNSTYENYEKNFEKANNQYDDNWNFQCEQLGLAPKSPLPNASADRILEMYNEDVKRVEEIYKEEKEQCFKLYGE